MASVAQVEVPPPAVYDEFLAEADAMDAIGPDDVAAINEGKLGLTAAL